MKCAWMKWVALGLSGLGLVNAAEQPRAEKIVLVPPTVLAFDAEMKRYTPKTTNDASAAFTFWVTNICQTNVLILEVTSSCGCTVAKFPSQPWLLQPWESGAFKVTLDLQGYSGTVFKGILVHTSAGVKALVLRADLPERKNPFPTLLPSAAAATNAPPGPTPLRPAWDRKPSRPPGLN
jgi:hypothetical protein